MADYEDLEQWARGGQRQLFSIAGKKSHIFLRTFGPESKPWLTLLHGFPTSSWDYAKVIPALQNHFRILVFDFLGFGNSDKPRNHTYTIEGQTDLTELIWKNLDIKSTDLVAHDYATSVGQELLARASHRTLPTDISNLVLMNGALYPHLHHPLMIQRLLNNPVTGPITTLLVNKKTFAKNMRKIFSTAHPLHDDDLEQLWQGVQRNGGNRLYHKLIHYLNDRKRNRERWGNALESSKIPLHFLWGMKDPISGAQVMEYVKERTPATTTFIELSDVGHYPQVEVPETIALHLSKLKK